jgi:hypothetical protein
LGFADELRHEGVLRRSDAGSSCIDPPPRAARKVSKNLRDPSEGFSMRAWPRTGLTTQAGPSRG